MKYCEIEEFKFIFVNLLQQLLFHRHHHRRSISISSTEKKYRLLIQILFFIFVFITFLVDRSGFRLFLFVNIFKKKVLLLLLLNIFYDFESIGSAISSLKSAKNSENHFFKNDYQICR